MGKGNYRTCLRALADERGSVLLTVYLVITVLLLLGAAFLVVTSNESRASEIQIKTTQAFYIAEAGIERAIYDLRQDFVTDTSSPSWSDGDINGMTIGPDTSNFYGIPYSSTSLNGGSYTVSLKNVSGQDDIWIKSTGAVDGISQTIQVYVRLMNLSPWNNAIFGGAGSSGGMVNGNVNIKGSVHILGNDLDDGDNAIDLGGTAELVGNNYDVGPQGLDAALAAKIPALPTTVFGGETVSTLNAELRVKKGLVGLSGSSSVGEANQPGNSVKETVNGTYVTDGYNGTAGTDNVFSDNGYTEAYDLGDAVVFPSLSDPYPDNPSQDYYEYFADNALVLTNELAGITPASNFTYGDCATNCITMDGSGSLYINGIVYVDGNNNLGITSGDFTYTGTGTILVTGSVSIDANLVTEGDDSFPNNILGIMTPNNILLGDTSQRDIMGLFFAEGTVATDMQTDVVGTIITNYFDASNQVPSIFQVPEAANNLPPGMIAGDPVWLIKIVSWQKL